MSSTSTFARTRRTLVPLQQFLLRTRLGESLFRAVQRQKAVYLCPLCQYRGPFVDIFPEKGMRRNAQCPKCWSGERHRLHYLCFEELRKQHDFGNMAALHIAPDSFFKPLFDRWFRVHHTGDLNMKGVDFRVDLTALPFEDASYDFVYASHVLEHIQDDGKALAEVRRVLRPGGMALLPVPLVSSETIEYPEPNRFDDFHWRAPGPDYFDRYRSVFSRLELRTSSDFGEEYQLHLYEDRSHFPTPELPLRRPMSGQRHIDILPIGYV